MVRFLITQNVLQKFIEMGLSTMLTQSQILNGVKLDIELPDRKHMNDLDVVTAKIKQEIVNVTQSFLYIGFLLYECDYEKTYKIKGYNNVIKYAEHELGFKKSSTYNYIKLLHRFGQKKDGFPDYQITNSYNNFTYSQLTEMLSLSDEKIALVNSDMSVREIRLLKHDDVFQTSGNEQRVCLCSQCDNLECKNRI